MSAIDVKRRVQPTPHGQTDPPFTPSRPVRTGTGIIERVTDGRFASGHARLGWPLQRQACTEHCLVQCLWATNGSSPARVLSDSRDKAHASSDLPSAGRPQARATAAGAFAWSSGSVMVRAGSAASSVFPARLRRGGPLRSEGWVLPGPGAGTARDQEHQVPRRTPCRASSGSPGRDAARHKEAAGARARDRREPVGRSRSTCSPSGWVARSARTRTITTGSDSWTMRGSVTVDCTTPATGPARS